MAQVSPEIENIIIEAIRDKKGRAITILDLSRIESAPSGKFIICQATNPTQAGAIADSVTDAMIEFAGRKPYHTDGYRNREWLILDYGDVMAHIFLPDTRAHYDLESLWGDAPATRLEDLD